MLLYWMARGCGGSGNEREPGSAAIVPERRYIAVSAFGEVAHVYYFVVEVQDKGTLCTW